MIGVTLPAPAGSSYEGSEKMTDNTKYQRVYFRIEAGYIWGKGIDENKLESINKELADIFCPLGFTLKTKTLSCSAPEYQRGAERLYCHPQSFSGYVAVDAIPTIESLLKQAKSFSFVRTDRYEEVYRFSDVELQNALKEQKENIVKQILEIFKTKRRNLYKPKRAIENVSVNIPCFNNSVNTNQIRAFIDNMFSQLLNSGLLTESENYKIGKIYRTAS